MIYSRNGLFPANLNRLFGFLAIVLAAHVGALPGHGHETDQFSVPTGREFADMRFWISDYFREKLSRAIEKTNEKIARTLVDGQPTPATARLQAEDALAWAVLLEFPPVIHHIESVETEIRSTKIRSQFPGLLTYYLPPQWIYHHPLLVLDPTKLSRLVRSSMLMANGTYFGTDKIAHFAHMGYLYSRTYRASLQDGSTQEEAISKAVDMGAGDHPLSERNILGFLSTGVVSNGDKAANYVGMKFYINLTEPVLIKGSLHPPLVVRRGEFFALNDHVRAGSDFFSAFISDHWNEALNPNTYAPGQERWVSEEVRKRCPEVLDWYRNERGERRTREDFQRIAEELFTYYGEDYGHEGEIGQMVSVMTVCFDAADATVSDSAASTSTTRQRDTLGRTPLWRAARAGRLAEVRTLATGSQLRESDLDGETPLHAAVRGGNAEVVRILLAAGADAGARNKQGATPLHLAAQYDLVQAAEGLLAAGAVADAADDFGCTPLHDAARRGSLSMVSLLVKSAAKVQIADNFGTTPLHRAARGGASQVVSALLAAGANAHTANAFGKTPLDEAHSSRDKETLALLLNPNRKEGLATDRNSTPTSARAGTRH